jgi:hypothetical protein
MKSGTVTLFMKVIAVWIFLVLAAAVTGCSTTGRHVQWYPGQPLETNQVALLKVQRDFGGINVPVDKINGESITKKLKCYNNTAKEIELLPGQYDLSVCYLNTDCHSTEDVQLSFTAEAGKIYKLQAASEEMSFGKLVALEAAGGQSTWTAWIVDAATGKVVAGQPREAPFHWYEK